MPVTAIREQLTVPTYGVGRPEKNPVFFEKRVYQGSCGKVYPVPFVDKVLDEAIPVSYDSARLENEFVRLVMLPEIGGRIFLGQDKTNRDYDFFYRQDVIKPALVGLAGPWISGGVEFNWPQHHRPGTFMPADVHIQDEPDGASTVWLSEHDPLNRLKGMHGIRLRPNSSLVECRVRLYNRTPCTQSFLWWANVAAKVHDNYQSFFPPDVNYVADHAARAMSSFPKAENDYYGVDYQNRPDANDLSWYKNIPVPTSYMVCETSFDFFGGYDYDAQGGFVHVANRHISPGKKQWTWGNHEFGWAWDRELTDDNGPYVELMAGVYTDNQPDFTYLLPYETKTFSQFWWPYRKLGPVQNANGDVAVRLVVEDGEIELGVAVSRPLSGARVILRDGVTMLLDATTAITPDEPYQNHTLRFARGSSATLELLVVEGESVLISYRPLKTARRERLPAPASEPAAPEDIETADELYLTGEHLELYRHPTRAPEPYWEEAIRRDAKDYRCNVALGRRCLVRGEFERARSHFAAAIERLTRRHPNPVTGEAHYYMGLASRWLDNLDAAYAAFYKATWNCEWRSASYYELACLDSHKGDWQTALQHLEDSLDTNRQNNKAVVLKAAVLRRIGRGDEARTVLNELLAIDPLDHWARAELVFLAGGEDWSKMLAATRNDAQTMLDIAFDYADAGLYTEALSVIATHHAQPTAPVAVPNPLERTAITHYVQAWLLDKATSKDAAITVLAEARSLPSAYFFPSRLHEQVVLTWAMSQPGGDPNAAFGLGNYYFDRKRHEEAIAMWESAIAADPACVTAHRNLGIAYWNVHRDGPSARAAYQTALALDGADPRLLYEFDQLRKKLGDQPGARLAELEAKRELVAQRDDCSVELATLYNQTGQPDKALGLLTTRRFHPWEGGEGQVLRQYTTARLLLGRAALENGNAADAFEHFQLAMNTPENLGEAYHLHQAKADVNYWLGMALTALDRDDEARVAFEASATEQGDFQAMAVTAHSELSYYRGLSLRELGREDEAMALFADLAAFAERELATAAQIDYFATSLPLLLVFEDDLDERKQIEMNHLRDLAHLGMNKETQ